MNHETAALHAFEALDRSVGETLVAQLEQQFRQRMGDQHWRAGMRLPSVRDLAAHLGVSRHTVVETYDRLVAAGLVESRRGSGFFVALPRRTARRRLRLPEPSPERQLDIAWLMQSMFQDMPAPDMPGSGLLPPDWLDAEQLASQVRAVGRSLGKGFSGYGHPLGFEPLRHQVALRLEGFGVAAEPEQILLCNGVTQAVDLILRQYSQPGDAVLVEQPGWFVLYARLHAFGLRPVGIPRSPDGLQTEALEAAIRQHAPRLLFVNPAVHNPTGTSTRPGIAHEILRLADVHDLLVVEDDTYGELHPGHPIRLAALDPLRRVIHVGGFSKTLSASLRVGYLAASPERVQELSTLKLLTGLTSPELAERVVHRVLAEGHFRRHLVRLRGRVDAAREKCLGIMQRWGLAEIIEPAAGMFVWANCGCDTEQLARAAAREQVFLAPGRLFLPDQPSTHWARFSVAMIDNPKAMRLLPRLIEAAAR